MKENFDGWLVEVLKHEGGFVDHPKDPGGATNKGVTIGTLRRLGIDVDGDGDSDIVDLRALRIEHVARVYRLFYWDAVRGDLLPSGIDGMVADFSVNSGPATAAKHLQRAVGAAADGDVGPMTLELVRKADPVAVIEAVTKSRMRFLQGLSIWPTFKNGWTARVNDVRARALHLAKTPPKVAVAPVPSAPAPAVPVTVLPAAGWIAWLTQFLKGFRK